MKTEKTIGLLLITGATGVLIPYILLTMNFEYPEILRHDTGTILTRFHSGGSSLILTWWAFAILGLPLLIAYIMIGQKFEHTFSFIKWVTTLGVVSGIVQIIGLLRWVFVVPVLANQYITASDEATKAAAGSGFQLIHQFGGVLLGEHLGQLFTIVWMLFMSYAFLKLKTFPTWVSVLGIAAAGIYLLAQAELFATVIPGFPVWGLAGFLGSTLWLIWLIVLGIFFIRKKVE
ncbi:MAG: DUF4386 domain-containing protein [Saprospiraceae bacterium]|nr:DUF4386 domain-containing protein [Saprospiraceae bacterium]